MLTPNIDVRIDPYDNLEILRSKRYARLRQLTLAPSDWKPAKWTLYRVTATTGDGGKRLILAKVSVPDGVGLSQETADCVCDLVRSRFVDFFEETAHA